MLMKKLKRMLREEDAIAWCMSCCTCEGHAAALEVCCRGIDIGFCGGEGMGRGILVPICIELIKLMGA